MEQDIVYLRPETKLEPLVCGWYAWSHLISPVQHAMNVLYRHIPLLQSFVSNPSVHIAAATDPELFAGPFVKLTAERISDVQELLRDTETRCEKLISFARELRQLDRRVQEVATAYSLNELYKEIPETLRGLVEFVYDTNGHARLRVYEDLIYDTNMRSQAEELILSLTSDEDRTFFMSTPRLDDPNSMRLPWAFSDRRIDVLSSLRTSPRYFNELLVDFGFDQNRKAGFERFITTEAPTRKEPEYSGDGVRVRYFGHACVLVQTARVSVLVDPMFAWDAEKGDGRFTFNDLPDRLDYVILSHNHQDHCSPEMLLQLRHRVRRIVVPRGNTGSIADPSMKLALSSLGFDCIDVLDWFDEIVDKDVKITALPFPGEHAELDIYSRQSILLEAKGRRIAFLVDSDGWDAHLFRRLTNRVGKQVDALFIGMECDGAPLSWLYGPLLPKAITRKNDESRTLSGVNCERACRVVQEFEPSRVYVYAMGQEPWLRHIMGLQYASDSIQLQEVKAFLESCKRANIAAENPFISMELEL